MAGRPKKTTSNAVPELSLEESSTKQPNTQPDQVTSPDLLQTLLAQVASLTQQLQALQQGNIQKPVESEQVEINNYEDPDEDVNLDIRADKYIKVISLCREKLNLSTEPYGRGKVHSFPKFGSTRQIMYSELVNIIHNNQKFIEEGRFYILDKNVVRKHGLREIYESILTKENIEKVLACNGKEALNLYKTANDKQRKLIDQMLVTRIRDGAEVDLNIVSAISKIAGYDLYQKAEEAKQFQVVTTENAS